MKVTMHSHKYIANQEVYQKVARPYRKQKARKNTHLRTSLEKDLLSMKKVWSMLKKGAVTWIGEIGRQY